VYRFSIEGEDWILRFSPQVLIEADEQQEIVRSLLHIGGDLADFSLVPLYLMWKEFHR